MKNCLKGFLILTMSLVVVFATATAAWAAVWIDSTELTSGVAFNGEEGTATYDEDNGTLSLNNFVYSGTSGISADGALTIDLIGENRVSAADGSAVESNENLTIQGDGALYAEGKGESYDGIITYGDLTITGENTTVTAKSECSNGIISYEDITIDNATVKAEGKYDGISAVDTYVDDDVYDGSITITGGNVEAKGENYGIWAGNVLTIGDSEVSAEGREGGIYTDEDVTIKDSEVSATGESYDGINVKGDLTITGETTTVTAKSTYGNGIISYEDITIDNATVKAEGGCSGITASDENLDDDKVVVITITGGNVEAKGTGWVDDGIHSDDGAILCGIWSDGDIIITESTVTAEGVVDGISLYDKLTITDSTVTAVGEETEGIWSAGHIVIDNATVKAEGGYDGITAVDTYVDDDIYDGSITITGGNVEAKGESYYGILASLGLTIDDATVKAEGGSSGIYADELTVEASAMTVKGGNWDIWTKGDITIVGGTLTASGGEDGVFSAEGIVSIDTDKTPGLSHPPIHYYPVVSDPVEEKTEVESPKTFDGGIALQIAMTALALTGSAWLMKKD